MGEAHGISIPQSSRARHPSVVAGHHAGDFFKITKLNGPSLLSIYAGRPFFAQSAAAVAANAGIGREILEQAGIGPPVIALRSSAIKNRFCCFLFVQADYFLHIPIAWRARGATFWSSLEADTRMNVKFWLSAISSHLRSTSIGGSFFAWR